MQTDNIKQLGGGARHRQRVRLQFRQQIIPAATQGAAEVPQIPHPRKTDAGLNHLNIAERNIGFFRQTFLSQPPFRAELAHAGAKNIFAVILHD